MHLTETYAHYAGVKPGKPFIQEDYFPIPFDKYIVIQAGAGMISKQYDYFSYVVEHLKYNVLQIGGKDDEKLPVTINLCGNTSWNQSAHLIRHASLFIGCDSACNHIASALGTPRIAVFGATSPLTCGGAWNKHKGVEMTPVNMQGCAAPCFNNECIRPQKCINSITPEMILAQIANVLGKDSIKPVKFLHHGTLSRQQILEFIPYSLNSQTFGTMTLVNGIMSVRCDLHEPNLEEFSAFCNQTPHKFVVLINPCDIDKFKVHHSKIERLLFVVTKENIKEGIQQMKIASRQLYKTGLISYLDHAEFNEYKLDMLDYAPIAKISYFESKPEHEYLVGKTINIKTSRKVIGKDGKFFLTYQDAKNDKNSVDISVDNANVTLDREHLKELQFLTIRQYA